MKTNEDKIYSFLGLATRAGKIVSGDDSTLLELKKGNIKLVIVANDASDNTKKLFKDKENITEKIIYTVPLNLELYKQLPEIVQIKDKKFYKTDFKRKNGVGYEVPAVLQK